MRRLLLLMGEAMTLQPHVAKNFSCKVVKSNPSRSKQQNIGAEYAYWIFFNLYACRHHNQ